MGVDGALFLGFVIGIVTGYLSVIIGMAVVSIGAPEKSQEDIRS